MHAENPYVSKFKFLHEVAKSTTECRLYFTQKPNLDKNRFNSLQTAECAVLIVSKDRSVPNFDLSFYLKNLPSEYENSKYLNKLSQHLDPMVFPLLFPKGDLGWNPNLFQNC